MPFMSYAHVLELRRWLEGTRANVICYGSEDYAEKIKRWSDTCERDAVCFLHVLIAHATGTDFSQGAIIEVTSTSEVSEAVKFARKHHINFVTEAGGHSTTGSSATHGGLVISLTKMRRVLTDPASKTVCVQVALSGTMLTSRLLRMTWQLLDQQPVTQELQGRRWGAALGG